MIGTDIFFASAAELNRRLKAKEFSAVELTRAFCERLEALGPRYNALALSLQPDALKKANGSEVRCKASHSEPKIFWRLPNIPQPGEPNRIPVRSFRPTPP
jgi:Asp-tRNA(Asn)/Glu-tRNA(Gln) amidotransferase A subunit family amidase